MKIGERFTYLYIDKDLWQIVTGDKHMSDFRRGEIKRKSIWLEFCKQYLRKLIRKKESSKKCFVIISEY